MSYLIGFHGPWLLVALILGGIVGWFTYQIVRVRWIDGAVWLVLALVALTAVLAISALVPGRPGYWLDLAVLMIVAYAIGCPVGWALRHLVSVGRTPVGQDIVVPRPGYVFPGGTLDDFLAARATSSPITATGSDAGADVPLGAGPDVAPATPPEMPSAPPVAGPASVSFGAEQGSPTSAQPSTDEEPPVAVASEDGEAARGGTITPPPRPLVAGSETLLATSPPSLPPKPEMSGYLATRSDAAAPLADIEAGSDLTVPTSQNQTQEDQTQEDQTQKGQTQKGQTPAPNEPMTAADISSLPAVVPAVTAPVVISALMDPLASAASPSAGAPDLETKPPVSGAKPSRALEQGAPGVLGSETPRDGDEGGVIAPLAFSTIVAVGEPMAPPGDPAVPRKMPALPDEDRHAGLRPDGWIAARDNTADDLQRIKGIGPQNEGRLHGLGIWHFDQIAAWTPDNVLWVGSYLAFHGRIDREKWIDQAKALASGAPLLVSKRGSAGKTTHPVDKGRAGLNDKPRGGGL